MKFQTDLIHFNIKNKNCRIYRKEDMDLTYPQQGFYYGSEHSSEIDLSFNLVSFKVSNFEYFGNILFGEVQILDTPKGHQLKELIKSGIKVVFRPVGQGIVDDNGFLQNYKLFRFEYINSKDDAFGSLHYFRRKKIEKIYDKITF